MRKQYHTASGGAITLIVLDENLDGDENGGAVVKYDEKGEIKYGVALDGGLFVPCENLETARGYLRAGE